jgi:hypothetical protein
MECHPTVGFMGRLSSLRHITAIKNKRHLLKMTNALFVANKISRKQELKGATTVASGGKRNLRENEKGRNLRRKLERGGIR